jgi:hypothetical protein
MSPDETLMLEFPGPIYINMRKYRDSDQATKFQAAAMAASHSRPPMPAGLKAAADAHKQPAIKHMGKGQGSPGAV